MVENNHFPLRFNSIQFDILTVPGRQLKACGGDVDTNKSDGIKYSK